MSDPSATGASPAATATADPLLEPPASCCADRLLTVLPIDESDNQDIAKSGVAQLRVERGDPGQALVDQSDRGSLTADQAVPERGQVRPRHQQVQYEQEPESFV